MSAPQFTPGPWLIHFERRWVVPAEDALEAPIDALPICQLRDPDERLTEDETLANGFLIAAAPELYEALATIVSNARIIPDPEMGGKTDTYSVPIFDIEQIAAHALAKALVETA